MVVQNYIASYLKDIGFHNIGKWTWLQYWYWHITLCIKYRILEHPVTYFLWVTSTTKLIFKTIPIALLELTSRYLSLFLTEALAWHNYLCFWMEDDHFIYACISFMDSPASRFIDNIAMAYTYRSLTSLWEVANHDNGEHVQKHSVLWHRTRHRGVLTEVNGASFGCPESSYSTYRAIDQGAPFLWSRLIWGDALRTGCWFQSSLSGIGCHQTALAWRLSWRGAQRWTER